MADITGWNFVVASGSAGTLSFAQNGSTISGGYGMYRASGNFLRFQGGTGGYLFDKSDGSLILMSLSDDGSVGLGQPSSVPARLNVRGPDNTGTADIIRTLSLDQQRGIGLGFDTIRPVSTSANALLRISSKGTSALALQTAGGSNVGIGTESAEAKLTIAEGDISLKNTGNTVGRGIFGFFTLSPNTPTTSGLIVGIRNQNDYGASIRFAFGDTASSGNADSSIAFWTMNNGADGGAERMRIAPSGNVGIGTTTPGGKLDVKTGTGGVDAINIVSGGTGLGDLPALNWKSSAGTLVMTQWTDAANGNSRLKSKGNLSFHTQLDSGNRWGGTLERMTILASGNVGIGNTNPQAQLQIGEQVTGSDGRVRMAGSNGSAARTWEIGPSPAKSYGFAITDTTPGISRLMIEATPEGKMGIGTINPNAHVDIVGPSTPSYPALRVSGATAGSGYAAIITGDLQATGSMNAGTQIEVGSRKIADSQGCYYA